MSTTLVLHWQVCLSTQFHNCVERQGWLGRILIQFTFPRSRKYLLTVPKHSLSFTSKESVSSSYHHVTSITLLEQAQKPHLTEYSPSTQLSDSPGKGVLETPIHAQKTTAGTWVTWVSVQESKRNLTGHHCLEISPFTKIAKDDSQNTVKDFFWAILMLDSRLFFLRTWGNQGYI